MFCVFGGEVGKRKVRQCDCHNRHNRSYFSLNCVELEGRMKLEMFKKYKSSIAHVYN